MAAAILHSRVDPTHRGNFPIIFEDDLLKDESPRKRQKISVKYNHRPQAIINKPSSIYTSNSKDGSTLTLSSKSKNEAGSFTYEGGQQPSIALALIFDPARDAFTVNKINSDFHFNLRTTPSESNTAKVIQSHPQIGATDSSQDTPKEASNAENGEDDDFDDQPPDPDNPYDYRHSLRRINSPPSQTSLNSPRPNHTYHASPLIRTSSPIQRARSRNATEKPAKQRKRQVLPKERKTKIHKDEHDPNTLVIDMGDDVKPHRSLLGEMLNERGRSGDRKPMSMRSVASSMSPSVRADSDEDRKIKANDDVDEIDLGESRFRNSTASDDQDAEGNGWDDEVDVILQQEMDQAMEGQGDTKQADTISNIPLLDSSSESEEE